MNERARWATQMGAAIAIIGLIGQIVSLWGNPIGAVAFAIVLLPGVVLLGWSAAIEWRTPTTLRTLPIPVTADLDGALSVTEAQAGGEVSLAHEGGEVSTT